MPQNFQVLRCYSCLVFQVHPTKKANKFECKLCGEKQSIKRHYGLGTGKECRIHVQKLNSVSGTLNETLCTKDVEDCDELEPSNENISGDEVGPKRESKWLEYVDENELNDMPDDTMFLADTEVVLDIPKKQRINNINNKLKRNRNTFKTDDYDDDISRQYGKRKLRQAESIEFNSAVNKSESNVKIEPLLSQLKTSNDGPKITAKRFLPPVINKSSKWAQFTDTSEDIENDDISIDLNEEINVPHEQRQLNLIGTSGGKLKDLNNYCFNKEKHSTKKFKNVKSSAYGHLSLQTLNNQRMPMKFISAQTKWTQYNDDDNIKQNIQHPNECGSHCQSKFSSRKPQKLFSLCDDSDLDTVLDI